MFRVKDTMIFHTVIFHYSDVVKDVSLGNPCFIRIRFALVKYLALLVQLFVSYLCYSDLHKTTAEPIPAVIRLLKYKECVFCPKSAGIGS